MFTSYCVIPVVLCSTTLGPHISFRLSSHKSGSSLANKPHAKAYGTMPRECLSESSLKHPSLTDCLPFVQFHNRHCHIFGNGASMRRGPNPAADRAAQNQQTIKSLLKLEPNKTCADCKRNKRPFLNTHPSVRLKPNNLNHRSKMGELEYWCVRVHSMFRHPPRHGHAYQPSQVSRSGRLDR